MGLSVTKLPGAICVRNRISGTSTAKSGSGSAVRTHARLRPLRVMSPISIHRPSPEATLLHVHSKEFCKNSLYSRVISNFALLRNGSKLPAISIELTTAMQVVLPESHSVKATPHFGGRFTPSPQWSSPCEFACDFEQNRHLDRITCR